jgi:hypothetical protein
MKQTSTCLCYQMPSNVGPGLLACLKTMFLHAHHTEHLPVWLKRHFAHMDGHVTYIHGHAPVSELAGQVMHGLVTLPPDRLQVSLVTGVEMSL